MTTPKPSYRRVDDKLPGPTRNGGIVNVVSKKGSAKLVVTVIPDYAGHVIPRARVELMGIDVGETDANGEWRPRRNFDPGPRELKVSVTGFGPTPPPGLPPREWEYSETRDFVAGDNAVLVQLVQVRPRVIATVQLVSTSPIYVSGARVAVGTIAQATTNRAGVAVTDAFTTGSHSVTVTKPGFRMVPFNPPLAAFAAARDYQIPVQMTDQWGLINCHQVAVRGMSFPTWFNTVFRKEHRGPIAGVQVDGGEAGLKIIHSVNEANFNTIFDDCAQWFGPEMTVREFTALFFYVYNETGGQFTPIVEPYPAKEPLEKRLKYLFEAVGKLSYNGPRVAGNIPAGKQLPAMRNPETGSPYALTPEQIAAWNSSSGLLPPNEPKGIYDTAKECDFHKFRGRGLGQLTGRSNYMTYAQPVFTANGLGSIDGMSDEELTRRFHGDKAVYYAIMLRFLDTNRRTALGSANADDFSPFGLGVSGASGYAKMFHRRCTTMLAAMDRDGLTITRK